MIIRVYLPIIVALSIEAKIEKQFCCTYKCTRSNKY